MPKIRLSRRAAADLDDIADYTVEHFGIEQARRYRDGLETCFLTLAENPMLGRSAEILAPTLGRFEHQSHVVFFVEEEEEEGVFIVRVLHASMDAPRHF